MGAGADAPFVAAEIRHLGEATRRDVEGGSAVGGREAGFTLGFIGADPRLFETVLPTEVERLIGDLRAWISPETNINFVGKLRSSEQFASAWPPETFARLAEVRRQHDPHGVFAYRY